MEKTFQKKIMHVNDLKNAVSYHPLQKKILSDEMFKLNDNDMLEHLDEQDIAFLCSQTILPVTLNSTNKNHYYLLSPCLDFFLLTNYPSAKKQKIQIHIYPISQAEEIILRTNLIYPSFLYRLKITQLDNLSKCHSLAKALNQTVPSKKKLALIANISPSAIRHKLGYSPS